MKKEITRITSFTVVIIMIFSILIARLFYVQLFKGDYYKSLAEEKGEKEIIRPAPRGEIVDRNGEKIATSKQGFNITFSNYQKKGKEKKEVYNERINKALVETLQIITKNADLDKLNLSAIPIAIEGNNYVYNFTATSNTLRAKLEKNLKKAYDLDKIEEKSNIKLDAKGVIRELGKKYGLLDENTGENIYKVSQIELLQLVSLRAAISSVSFSQYKTVYIAKNVKKETAFAIMYKGSELPGISNEVAPIREYPNGEVGSAFLGYLGKISEDSAEEYKNLGYDINRELIGRLGLEKSLENNRDLGINLRGEPGVRYVNVDKFGQITKETATLDPIPGDTVKTTIDINLQKVAEESLDKTMESIRGKSKGGNAKRGAAIVTDVKTGEILALASRPGFDPNVFAQTGAIADPEIYKKYFVPEKNEGDKADLIPAPMFNYATKGAIPPGSILKPFVGIAGLEEGVVNPSTIVVDKGGPFDKIKGFKGACWIWNTKRGSHGPVNVSQALEVSCNIYFFEVGRLLGYERFSKWAAKFGFASDPKTGEKPKSGIEIEESPGEVGSDVKYKKTNLSIFLNDISDKISGIEYGGYTITKGTDEYKAIQDMIDKGQYDKTKLESIGVTNLKAQRYIKQKIAEFKSNANNVGQLLSVSIGQGSTLLTPLQMIGALNTLLNDGKRYSTHLVKEVLNPDGTVKREIAPELLEEFKISPENKDAILKGMSKVTSGEHGTAASTFRGFNIPTGGKTGSASVPPSQKEKGRDAYGWFLGFAPYEDPQISVVVVIYDAGSGSFSAPVARDIYEQYFGLNKKDDKKSDNGEVNKTAPLNESEAAYQGVQTQGNVQNGSTKKQDTGNINNR
ncbi:penicillin-binding transpeptidase domain-containing protein [Clostridium cylindrosporum]|uniref:Penicillin-binding protein 2 n=1 Tax=Clostridium cylindrosporum DSM 605 TaxID=1121307 RepID=A0A0J8D617_CLOCY|nr:penicillin-binding transpeptidase domain-containing protein [Clostridium cylindrosporum]KMT21540.1 penicillin-binding protein 2 [Clostridium cylindrosporum DSM 605]